MQVNSIINKIFICLQNKLSVILLIELNDIEEHSSIVIRLIVIKFAYTELHNDADYCLIIIFKL